MSPRVRALGYGRSITMNDIKRLLAAAAAVTLVGAATSCESGKTSEDSIEEITYATQPATKDASEIRGQKVVWLADYDLRAADGTRPTALALFEDVYGAKVEFVRAEPEEKYEKLDSMVLSGDEVDMFPYEEGALPDGVSRKRFDSLDPYRDILGLDEEGLWDDIKGVINTLVYDGGLYVVPYDVSDPQVLIYSRNIISEQELGDDPYQLYLDGKWDWDAFMKLMEAYVEKDSKHYGVCGDLGRGLLLSTGSSVVSYGSSGFVNNIADPKLEKAGQLMEEIVSKKLYCTEWKGSFPADKSSLFFAGGSWALPASNASNPNSGLMAVPFPKAPGESEYHIGCDLEAKMLVKNSTKGAAVATYIKCERTAASREDYKKAAKELALAEEERADGRRNPFMTEEQYDAVESYKAMFRKSPAIDIAYGMGSRMYGSGDYTYETRGVMDNLTGAILSGEVGSWSELCDKWSEVVDAEVANYN